MRRITSAILTLSTNYCVGRMSAIFLRFGLQYIVVGSIITVSLLSHTSLFGLSQTNDLRESKGQGKLLRLGSRLRVDVCILVLASPQGLNNRISERDKVLKVYYRMLLISPDGFIPQFSSRNVAILALPIA
jgi:hypothetical protein